MNQRETNILLVKRLMECILVVQKVSQQIDERISKIHEDNAALQNEIERLAVRIGHSGSRPFAANVATKYNRSRLDLADINKVIDHLQGDLETLKITPP